ncbi:tol-pal system protein YbgF [Thauera sp. CAU 1555]|uniref:Cell division coordinator CpoB n=1 Tax=Thauera sedimentorum TaxID=2767595 RepID=A0ABR9BB42_9RHOO|nr:tol-pal system protein YbgF [Thauera sedimentorum]MBC9072655.1 tol-pal system protein YbgF [Thauera sedimentorum]MBD8503574.1 tol-pal system protein YbgF [Thauera sedimentorum]
MKRLVPLAALLILPTVASAQLFGGGETQRQVDELRENVNQRLEASSRAQLELSSQNELLRAEVARLRGQIEVLMHEVESLKQRQRDFYVDLDDRLRRLESPGGAAQSAADPAAESAEYETALNLLKDGKHREALTAFDGFIAKYTNSGFLPGAHFWAGNAALQAKEVATAANHFNTILARWPADAVAPDAMLGLANSQQALGDAKASQRTLQSVVERYPESTAAKAARQRLGIR